MSRSRQALPPLFPATLWTAVVWTAVLSTFQPAWCQVRKVTNPSFETVGNDSIPVGWTPESNDHDSPGWRARADRKIAHKGNSALRLTIWEPRTTAVVEGERFTVEPGTVYTVSGWVFLESVESPHRSWRGFLRVRWYGERSKDGRANLLSEEETYWGQQTGDWFQVAGTFEAPEEARLASILCVGEQFDQAETERTVWFDNITVVVLRGLPLRTIEANAAPEAIPAAGPYQTQIRAKVTTQEGRPVADGTVVGFQTNHGKVKAWSRTRSGIVTASLQVEEGRVCDARVIVRSGFASDTVRVGDDRAATVRGRIYDSETGLPLAARVWAVLENGDSFPTRYENAPGIFGDGTFVFHVPPGSLVVHTSRGFEYTPPKPQEIVATAGDIVEMDLPYKRWVDLTARGWYGGDPYMRASRGDRLLQVGMADAAVIARSQGLQFCLLTEGWDTSGRRYSIQQLDDALAPLNDQAFRMGWNQVWPSGIEGKQWFMNVRDLAGFNRNVPGFEAHARIHDQRGIVSYTQPFRSDSVAGGILFDTLAGPTYDGIDVMSTIADDVPAQQLWYLLLNKGYRVAGTASSGAALDVPDTVMPGRFRIYTHVEGDATMEKLAQAMAAGRNFITSGPLLLFSVFAAGPGADLSLGGRRRATVQAWASSDPEEFLTRVELIRSGIVEQYWDLEDHPRSHRIAIGLQDSVDTWYLVKCYGSDSTQVAITNPIFFKGRDSESPQPVRAVVRGHVNGVEEVDGFAPKVEVLNPLGDVILETVARGGQFQIWVPPSSHIRVSLKGYQSEVRHIFQDTDLAATVLAVSRGDEPQETLYTWETYDQMIKSLQDISLHFELKPQ